MVRFHSPQVHQDFKPRLRCVVRDSVGKPIFSENVEYPPDAGTTEGFGRTVQTLLELVENGIADRGLTLADWDIIASSPPELVVSTVEEVD